MDGGNCNDGTTTTLATLALTLDGKDEKIWGVLGGGYSGYYCWRPTTPGIGCCFSRSFGRLGSAPAPRGHHPKQMDKKYLKEKFSLEMYLPLAVFMSKAPKVLHRNG